MSKLKLQPLEYRVVVKPDPIETKMGFLEKPAATIKKERLEQCEGELVAISNVSFVDWEGDFIPLVGNKVRYAMYAGEFFKEGEVEYKIMNANNIVGIIKE